MTPIDLLPLVLALPLVGAVLLTLGGRWLRGSSSGWLATALVGLSFALSIAVAVDYLWLPAPSTEVAGDATHDEHAAGHRSPVVQVLWHWFAVGEDLVDVTIAAYDLPLLAPIPEGAAISVPVLMSDPWAQELFGPVMSDMWDPDAVEGLTPMSGVIPAGTPLTRHNLIPGPDGFVPAVQWSERRFEVDVAFQLDGLSLLMTLLVTGVGFVIHLYSIGYMAHDSDVRRFFAYLNLFVFSMLTLVLAANFLVLFVGWELVGLCSYLLIGFWFADKANADAGRKAFIVNRVGDFAFLLGLMLIWSVFGSLAYSDVLSTAWLLPVNGTLAIAIAALLLIGATGKSAQIPLFVWLPDAMAGPTPVSALIHAATMVTAGIYMIVRASPLFEQAPAVMAVIAVIGLATALLGGLAASVQLDIKRWLAYSTVSQLGFMFLAVGGGAYVAGMLHLTAHAFFKALLFLGAGSVMHAVAHGFESAGVEPVAVDGLPAEQDMRNMGGLLRRLKITGPTFLVGGLALAGLFPFVGFFSKDEILLETLAHGSGGVDLWSVLWAIAMFGALITAFYSGRGLLLVLSGEPRSEGSREAHESPLTMTVPLLLLALLTVFGGLLALRIAGREPAVESLLAPVVAHPEAASEPSAMTMALLATGVTLVGLLAAWLLYGRRVVAPERLAGRLPRVHAVAYRAFYVDEIYMALIVRPFRAASGVLWHIVDDRIIDGAVNGVGRATLSVGQWSRRLQTGYVRTYVLAMLLGAVLIVMYLLMAAR